MSAWTWVLVAFCAAGVLLVLISVVPVISAITRVRQHLQELRVSPILVSMQSLQLQSERVAHTASLAAPLTERAGEAVASINNSVRNIPSDEAREALEQSGASISALVDDLR